MHLSYSYKDEIFWIQNFLSYDHYKLIHSAIIKNTNNMYSLDCPYFEKYFKTVNELISYVIESGMDPNYEITKNDDGIGELAIDYISF